MNPSYWQTRYVRGDTPWDKGRHAPALREILDRFAVHGTILVPGCGRGHDVRFLAAQGLPVVGIDVAPASIGLASLQPPGGDERYRVSDFLDMPRDTSSTFDWVIEHTLFCALDPAMRTRYVDAVHRALRPGGHFAAIFYMEPDASRQPPPFGVSTAELSALFGSGFRLLQEWIPSASFPSRAGRELVRVYERLHGGRG